MPGDDFSHLPEPVPEDRGRFWSSWPAAVVVGVAVLGVLALAAASWWLFTILASHGY